MDITKILKSKKALVFDFDGTMCQLFVNYKLNDVIEKLHLEMKKYSINFSGKKDSFDVFEVINEQVTDDKIRSRALIEANMILTNAECEAVRSGKPVSGVERVIPLLFNSGLSIGISTNNSSDCVEEFIRDKCQQINIPIVGRVGERPELMKPNPWSLLRVIEEMKCKPENVIFVGDTERDYDAAINAGCIFIGMTPTERKKQRLIKVVDEKSIVTNFDELIIRLNHLV